MGSSKLFRFWPLALIFGAGTAGAAAYFEVGPSAIIFPKQQIPVYFDHALHVRAADDAKGIKGAAQSCTSCHDITESTNSADRHIPGHDTCENCHDMGYENEPIQRDKCLMCHKDLDPAGTSTLAAKLVIPPPNLKFPHASHAKAGVECVSCHENVGKKTVATRDDYPTMDRCLGCHQEKQASTECKTCHLTQNNGRLVTSYPEGKLMPSRYHSSAIHDADFLRDHAVPAQRDKALCESCHTQNDCLSCHDGIGRDARYHPADWISTHFVRAKKDDFRCQSCHRLQTFCTDCHVRSGVATAGTVADPYQRLSIRRDAVTGQPNGPHPMSADGWLNPASRNFHGFHAQRNIRACASCHQEQYCVSCHGSAFGGGSVGGNPHGANPQRLKGSTAAKRNARACLKCHSPSDPSWR